MHHYFVLNVRNASHQAEAWLSQQAFHYGASGMSEALPFDQPEGEEDVITKVPTRHDLDIYFEQPPALEFVESLRVKFPDLHVEVKQEATKDWLAEWKKSFKPFRLTGAHWVVPSWCEAPVEATHKIWIDPGMAFGTGTHETTQLVAEELVNLLARDPACSLLDVGTGSGILAILARQLGVPEVWATEIDAEAQRVARENFVSNKFLDIHFGSEQVGELADKKSAINVKRANFAFDIVLANIIDGALVRIQEPLKACVKPGGWLVVSGIIREREEEFVNNFYLPKGVTWNIRRAKGDWRLLAAKF